MAVWKSLVNSNIPLILDPLIHQPTRTKVIAFLCSREEASFSELKGLTSVTDGNLDSHMKKLVASGYISTRKEKQGKRAITLYQLTSLGRREFKKYIENLKSMIEIS